MDTENDLIRRAIVALDDMCGCDRFACKACRLRNEATVYIEAQDAKAKRAPLELVS